ANLLQARIYFEKNDNQRSSEYLKLAMKERSTYSFTSRGQLFEFCLAMERKTYPPVPGLSLEHEIKMAIDIGNIYYQGIAYRYLACMQEDKNDAPETILNSFKTSLSLLEKSGGQFEIARTKEALARYYYTHGNLAGARKHIKDAAKIYQNYGNRQVADDLGHLLGNIQIKENLVEEILSFGPEVVEIKDIKIVAQRILSIIIRITQAERGAIFLYPDTSGAQDIELLGAKNLSEEDMEKPGFEMSRQMILKSAQNCKEYLDSTSLDSATGNNSFQNDDSIKSRICVPLLRRGKAIGVLYHDNRLFQSTFKRQDLKILSYFAAFAAIALDNAQAYEKIKALNQRLFEEKNYLEEQQLEHLHFEDFVAASPEIKKVLTLVKRVADTEATVLILGETGVGKEMVARAIHQQSRRRDKPFIRVNCSAFPESLIASELFGHEKGSFTGAAKRRIGRFELADTGTLFLDEIGDISMDIQIRLLRVLQTRKFERVGSSETISSDFRLLTATNRNLEKAVAQGQFRQDLFYRLNVFPIHVPPLRERMKDVSPLAVYFLKKHSDRMNKSFKGIAEKEMEKLLSYHWPGNVRELENVIERGVILNTRDPFTIPELSLDTSDAASPASPIPGQITLEEMERRFIFDTLEKTNWKIYGTTGAANLLGLHHSTLYSRMKKLGIQNPNKK
ncbi:MAG: sigma 54-interacting transcriptional regulator, partial [Proteobacteria bacterium]|nr:sigma 54-interacting transcriptional regulator [Pseudomonadota bacterium]